MIQTKFINRIAVIQVDAPRLDAGTGLSIKEAIVGLGPEQGRFIVDMSRVKLVDSGGLGGLVACLKAVTVMKGKLILAGLQKPVRVMFELSRMDRQFDIQDNLDQSLTVFS